MEWPEVKRRLTKEGTSVQVLADLEGVPYKTMYNRIMQHQIKDGVTYLTPQNSKGLKRSEEMKAIKRKKNREAEKAQGLPEVPKAILPAVPSADFPDIIFNCDSCRHKVVTPDTFEALCAYGHKYGGINAVCSDYHADESTMLAIEMRKNKEHPCNVPPKLPEVVKEPENIPEDVYTKKEEPRLLVPVSDPEREGLCPEVMEALQENYEICRKLAERYLRQANDYAHLLKRYGVDIPKAREEMMRKLPEVFKHE